MPYEYLEEVATADIAFRAWDPDLDGVFIAAADATMNVMVEDLASIRPVIKRDLKIENASLELLLFDLLQELIYYKDAEALFLRVTEIRIGQKSHSYLLLARCSGEKLDPERHHTRVDVKAVTMHRFSLQRIGDIWEAFIVLDV